MRTERKPPSGSAEILIVEDSATQSERLDYLLTKNGYATRRARDGKEALAELAKQRPALVVSDILMPNMDGFTLCRRLQADERYRDLPVILLTALSDPEDVLKGLASGAVGFIIKPSEEQELLERVRRVLTAAPYLTPPPEPGEVPFRFRGREYRIAAGRVQILDLLISIYETAISSNRELQATREQLEALNQELERKVEERTRLLAAEVEERKRAEREVKILNEELESRIRDRTAQLERINAELQHEAGQRRLMEQDREKLIAELSRSNRDLDQFAYIISHDLQSPLRSITGFLDLLARRYHGRLGQDADEFISFAVEGAQRVSRMINDILAYSRVSTQGKNLEIFHGQAALDQALANLQAAIADNQAVISQGELPSIRGDRTQIMQLFQNLVGNAIKYRKPGEPPRIHIAAEPRPGEWLFRVTDNGIGIEPRYGERIFQVFQRLHTPKEYPGTGIGLAICKKIVERHGGRIWMESVPGQGATFYFTLPQADSGR